MIASFGAKARAQGLWCPFRAEGIWRHGDGPLANALVQMELGEENAGARCDETRKARHASMMTILAHGRQSEREVPEALGNGERGSASDDGKGPPAPTPTGMTGRQQEGRNEELRSQWREVVLLSASVAEHGAGDGEGPIRTRAPTSNISTFIVENCPSGYRIKRNIENMGFMARITTSFRRPFRDRRSRIDESAADNLIGGEGNGVNMGQHRLAYGRSHFAHGMS